MEFKLADQCFRTLVCHGGNAIEQMMKIHAAGRLKEIDVVEVMMCPSGCINGGGQPKIVKKRLVPNRANGLDKHDIESEYKDCESNKKMHEMLSKWMPTEHDIHNSLHTHYDNRRMK